MPYRSIQDLPGGIRKRLPRQAQEIYRDVFNSAWTMYSDPKKTHDGSAQKESHRIAWEAVQHEFVKESRSRF